MSRKLNVWPVIRAHYKTLSNGRTGRLSLLDFFVFVVSPALGVWALKECPSINFSDSVVAALIGAMAIFGGLLFNLLVLLQSQRRVRDPEVLAGEGGELLQEVFANVSYAILITVACLGTLLVYYLVDGASRVAMIYASGYLVVHFVLVMLMVLKRMHYVLSFELAEQQERVRSDAGAAPPSAG